MPYLLLILIIGSFFHPVFKKRSYFKESSGLESSGTSPLIRDNQHHRSGILADYDADVHNLGNEDMLDHGCKLRRDLPVTNIFLGARVLLARMTHDLNQIRRIPY